MQRDHSGVRMTTIRDVGPSPAVRIAVIGYGYWGPNLVRNFANTDGARVVSVNDLDPEKLMLVRRRHPDVAVTSEFRDLLKDSSIDAIAIATPVPGTWPGRVPVLERSDTCAARALACQGYDPRLGSPRRFAR